MDLGRRFNKVAPAHHFSGTHRLAWRQPESCRRRLPAWRTVRAWRCRADQGEACAVPGADRAETEPSGGAGTDRGVRATARRAARAATVVVSGSGATHLRRRIALQCPAPPKFARRPSLRTYSAALPERDFIRSTATTRRTFGRAPLCRGTPSIEAPTHRPWPMRWRTLETRRHRRGPHLPTPPRTHPRAERDAQMWLLRLALSRPGSRGARR